MAEQIDATKKTKTNEKRKKRKGRRNEERKRGKEEGKRKRGKEERKREDRGKNEERGRKVGKVLFRIRDYFSNKWVSLRYR